MTNLENKIPIKGYATFDPLKHGGVHCITQDLYREGTQEDYFG